MNYQLILLNKIIKDLNNTSTDQIFPVSVPMLINKSWEECYYKTYKHYKKAKLQKNRIKILAYSFHLGSLILACSLNNTFKINLKNKKAWIRTYHLFKIVGYHKLYKTQKLKLKYIYYLSEENFKQLLQHFI